MLAKRITCLLFSIVLLLGMASFASAKESEDPGELNALELLGEPLAPEKIFSSAKFLEDDDNSTYVDRMIDAYTSSDSDLMSTLVNGSPVIMFFEGASDNTPAVSGGTDYRDGALCIVLKYDTESSKPYIAYHCENCTTMPDYPFYAGYDNGHDGYGSGIAVDGTYNIYTVNHKSIYAAFNVRTGDNACVPAVYMNEDGGFSVLNAIGINIHTRFVDSVSGDPDAPRSAGCLLVGDAMPFDEYLEFINCAAPAERPTEPATFNEGDIVKYTNSTPVKAGMVVIDRYLAKDTLMAIYGDSEAVETITANSTLAQADSENARAGFTFYPTYLSAKVSPGVELMTLPGASIVGAESAGTTDGEDILVTGIYLNGSDEYWYRCIYGGKTLYFPASKADGVTHIYDDLSIHNTVSPTVKRYKKAFSVSGIAAVTYNRYTEVSGKILSMEGTEESTASATVPFVSYSLNASDGATVYRDSLDNKLAFSRLVIGNHRYMIEGTVRSYYISGGGLAHEDQTVTLVNQVFRVAYYATLDAVGGTVSPTEVLTNENNAFDSLPTPTRPGYVFMGWYDAAENGDLVTPNTIFDNNKTLYARWIEYVEPEYGALRFETNGGEALSDIFVCCGGTISLRPFVPTREGFVFCGWCRDRSLSEPITELHMIEDTTVYAVWEKAVTPEDAFPDVSSDNLYYADIKFCYDRGLMDGMTDGLFGAESVLSRAMASVMLYRLAGCPEVSGDCPFDDVPAGSYYETAVTYLYEAGIVLGDDCGRFNPDDAITREQLMAMLYRFAVHSGAGIGETDHSDMPDNTSSDAADALRWAASSGILLGDENGNLMPHNTITRSQAAAVFHRFCMS